MNSDVPFIIRKTIRLNEFDYTHPSAYFITICAFQKQHLFGSIKDSKMYLNGFGEIVKEEWIHTSELRRYIDIESYIVMPNHFHAIVVIHQPNTHFSKVSEPRSHKPIRSFSEPMSESLSTIVGSFKSAVSKKIHQLHGLDTRVVWQRSFYDHIIRNEYEHELIYKYIDQNPELWERDHNNPKAKDVIKGIKGLESIFKSKNNPTQ